MLRLAGCLCILAGCVGWGGNKIREEKKRIRHLQELIRIIRRIQSEIRYGKHTLPEICRILADEGEAWCAPYFEEIYRQMMQESGRGLKEAWDGQMKACMQDLPLQEEERDIIMKLPAFLGLQEETRQAMSFSQSVELLGRKCRQAEDAYENRAKMIHSVSILAGLLLSILLL